MESKQLKRKALAQIAQKYIAPRVIYSPLGTGNPGRRLTRGRGIDRKLLQPTEP